MVIAKTASRNVPFKAARMSESALERSQDEAITRKPEGEERTDTGMMITRQLKMILDVTNGDLYISNLQSSGCP